MAMVLSTSSGRGMLSSLGGKPRAARSLPHLRGLVDGARKQNRGQLVAAGDQAKPIVTRDYLAREARIHDDVTSMRLQAQQEVRNMLLGAQSSQDGKAQAGSASHTQSLVTLRSKIRNAIKVMQHGLVERDTEVRLLLLAALSGEHILLIGPPGTAKSEVGRRLNKLIDGTYFERLLTRFSVPEELFGPLSMRALEEDKYVRQTTGYLPEAEVAFIDEIFKANSAILNTLLTLINERQFDNGNQRVDVPLLSVVGASNELPESEELDALYDRFLVRRAVKQVSAAGVGEMLSFYTSGATQAGTSDSSPDAAVMRSQPGTSTTDGMLLTREDITRCKAEALRTVRVPPPIIQMVIELRSYLQEKMEPVVYVSDRRLVKCIQLLQVAAYCNGRTTVSEYDVLLLQHVLWQRPEQANRIADWIMSSLSVDDGVKQVQYLLSGLFSRACRCLGDATKADELRGEVGQLRDVLREKLLHVAGNVDGERFPVIQDNLWLSAEDSDAVVTALEPKLRKTRTNVETVLMDVALLEVALRSYSSPVALANLMPRQWADFIRNSDIKDVDPIGTTPLAGYRKP